MNNAHLSRAAVLAFVSTILFSSHQTHSYPYGYTKLYNDSTDTVVDLIYDTHVPRTRHWGSTIHGLTYAQIKNELWPIEVAVLDAFESLNARSSHSIDLLWESSPARPIDSAMLIACESFVNGRFFRLPFKHSDTWRPDFSNLFFRHGVLKYGVSMNKPLPVYESMRSHIARNAGSSLLNAYESFSQGVEKEVKNYFKPHYDRGVKVGGEHDDFWLENFHRNDTYHAIADAEMISNILSSDKKRVILYAGGWHCTNISRFLKKNGYHELHHKVNSIDYTNISTYVGLESYDLAPLSQIHYPRQRPDAPISPSQPPAYRKPVAAPRAPQKAQPRRRGKAGRMPMELSHMHLGLSAAHKATQASPAA